VRGAELLGIYLMSTECIIHKNKGIKNLKKIGGQFCEQREEIASVFILFRTLFSKHFK
jgi:hypothetical protein